MQHATQRVRITTIPPIFYYVNIFVYTFLVFLVIIARGAYIKISDGKLASKHYFMIPLPNIRSYLEILKETVELNIKMTISLVLFAAET
jgi:hypothetical protein